jgi:hypothetical protein
MNKLLVRPKPVEGECFGGYVVRLAHSNGYKNVNSFCKDFCDVSRHQWYRVPLRLLSDLTGIIDKDRENIWLKNHRTYGYSYRGIPIPDILVSVGGMFCAQCLSEDNIRRAQWNLGIMPICLKHGTLLSKSCTKCISKFGVRDDAECNCISEGLENVEHVSLELVEQVKDWEQQLLDSKEHKQWQKQQLKTLTRAFVELRPSKYGRHYPQKAGLPKLPRYPFTPTETVKIYTSILGTAA